VATIADARRVIAYAIQNGLVSTSYPEGLRVDEYVRDNFSPPCAEVHRREYDPRMVFSQAKAPYQFTVRVYAGRTHEQWSQVFLDDLCDINTETSLTMAVQDTDNWPSDVTLDYVEVTRIGEIVAVIREEVPYLMVEFDIEVVF
jgi:hypothetical protein